jgi:Tfp pilus assembly protein PilF
MDLYRKALRLYPRSAQILNNLGANLLMQLNTEKRPCSREEFWLHAKSPMRASRQDL